MRSTRTRRLAAAFVALGIAGALGACGGASAAPTPAPPAQAPEDPYDDTGTYGGQDKLLVTEWAWDVGENYGAAAPAADGAGVAVTSGGHRVIVFDRAGKVRWVADREGVRPIAPALTADLVITPCIDGLVAHDRSGGKLRWELSVGQKASTPVPTGNMAVFTTRDGTLRAADLRDGRERWAVKLPGPVLGRAATNGTTAVATFDAGRSAGAVAVDLATGRERWKVDLPGSGLSAPAVSDRMVVLIGGDAVVRGLSLADGSERWRAKAPGRGVPEFAPVPAGDGAVIVGHSRGMALYDAKRGDLAWGAYIDHASVIGAPAGPGPDGWFALPLDDGTLMLAHVNERVEYFEGEGRVTGVASGPGGLLIATTSGGRVNGVGALSGW